MVSLKIAVAFAAFGLAYAADIPSNWTYGMVDPKIFYSQGGNAICASSNVPISISATTTKLLLSEPSNQTEVTQIFQDLLSLNSTIAARANGGPSTVQDTFQIDTTYCVPSNATKFSNAKTIQLLTHGIGLDKTYWDIAPGYSYVDAAAISGYVTIAYNRLGVGASDHPDPLQVVQGKVKPESNTVPIRESRMWRFNYLDSLSFKTWYQASTNIRELA